jgi:hypothetical protein
LSRAAFSDSGRSQAKYLELADERRLIHGKEIKGHINSCQFQLYALIKHGAFIASSKQQEEADERIPKLIIKNQDQRERVS